MFSTKTCILSAMVFASASMATVPTFAADMIEYTQQRHTVARTYRPHVTRTAYVARQAHCDELVIEYRYPYDPRTEIVRHCNRY